MTLHDDANNVVMAGVRSVLEQSAVPGDARLLIACSGGQDSSALMHAMSRVGAEFELELTVAHFNHQLRGENSDSDEIHVRWQAGRLDLPIVVGRPGSKLIGDEASARQARFQFLAETAIKCGIGWAATGHTLSDQVETVLLRLARGSGLRGVGGMGAVDPFPLDEYRNRLRIVRPLLGVPRESTEEYCLANDWSYVVDGTNLSDDHARNRIRNRVLPVLADLNPKVVRAIGRFADIAREQCRFVDRAARDWLDQHGDTSAGLLSLPIRELSSIERGLQRVVVRLAIESVRGGTKDSNLIEVDRALVFVAGEDRSSANLGGGLRAVRLYERLWFEPDGWLPARLPDIELRMPGRAALPDTGRTLIADHVPQPCSRPKDLSWHVDIPLDEPAPFVMIRGRMPGDRIRLKGVGTKKVQDVLVDAKVPRPLRDLTPMVLAGQRLVWIVGQAADFSGKGGHWLCLRIEPA